MLLPQNRYEPKNIPGGPIRHSSLLLACRIIIMIMKISSIVPFGSGLACLGTNGDADQPGVLSGKQYFRMAVSVLYLKLMLIIKFPRQMIFISFMVI